VKDINMVKVDFKNKKYYFEDKEKERGKNINVEVQDMEIVL